MIKKHEIIRHTYICKKCGYVGYPKIIYTEKPRIPTYVFFALPILLIITYFAVSLFYCLLVFLGSVFYIIYAIWWEKERLICPECGSNNIVYCDKFMQQIDPSTRVKIIRSSDKEGNQEKELKKEKEDLK